MRSFSVCMSSPFVNGLIINTLTIIARFVQKSIEITEKVVKEKIRKSFEKLLQKEKKYAIIQKIEKRPN